MSQVSQMIAKRSELLAIAALTRRLNVDVHLMGDKSDQGLDLICTIRHERVKGFLPFGVVVWGTSKELNAEDAAALARAKRKNVRETAFFFPVVLLVFSMHNDEGFFSWLVQPSKESNKLIRMTEPRFKPFDARQLDRMMNRITKWYERVEKVMIAGPEDVEALEAKADVE